MACRRKTHMVLEHTVLHHTSLTHMVLEHMLLERVVRERGGAEAQCPSKALLTHLVFQKNPNMYFPAAFPNHYPMSLTGIIFLRSSVPMSNIECCYGKLPGTPVTPLSALEIPRDSKIVEDSVPSPYTYATKSSPRKVKNYFILFVRVLGAAPKFSAIHAKQFPAPADTPSPRFLTFVSRGFPSSFHFEVLQKSSGFSHGPPRTFHSWSPESVI